jgi:hypothetical protein
MMKRHAVISFLVVGFFMFTGFASNVDAFSFTDSVVNHDSLTWTHTLKNDDFDPALSGGEAIEVTAATLTIILDVTLNDSVDFGYGVWTARGDDIYLDTFFLKGAVEQPFYDVSWEINLGALSNAEDALNAGEDRSFKVQLIANSGAIAGVDSSILEGEGQFVPIPTSVFLLGSGLVCVVGLRRKFRGQGCPSADSLTLTGIFSVRRPPCFLPFKSR